MTCDVDGKLCIFVICNQSLLADQLVTDDRVIIANNKYLGSYICR
jgi:hypothetical protein